MDGMGALRELKGKIIDEGKNIENTGRRGAMKKYSWRICGSLVALFVSVDSAASEPDINALNQNVLDACPVVWEDIKTEIDPSNVSGDVWGEDTNDRETFKAFLATMMGAGAPPAAELDAMASDTSTVASECATQRIAMLDALLSRLPKEALQAMGSVLDQLDVAADAIAHGGWRIGNVRITGRLDPAPGWVFLNGQTIGSPDSGARLTGDVLEDLFELAKTWYPNTGSESWSAGDMVSLPDMRGRTMVGTNAMGGTPSTVVSNSAANQVGGVFGEEKHELTVAEMPSHTHGMNNAGNHRHKIRVYDNGHGSGYVSGWNAQYYTHESFTQYAGSHKHTLQQSGGGQAHDIVQPSIVFNVEMKFALGGGDGDMTVNLPPGSEPSAAAFSCKAIRDVAPESPDGVYWLDVNGGDTADAFQAYCDMTSDGGGWTMVVAQFEEDPVTDWDEGIQPDYDPTLSSAKGFAFNTLELPSHSEIGFGKDLTATEVDYADFVYSTGNIDKQILVGKRTGKTYHIHRNDQEGHWYCDPESTYNMITYQDSDRYHRLTFDETGGAGLTWCFVSSTSTPDYRSFSMLGSSLYLDSVSFAWTVWIR